MTCLTTQCYEEAVEVGIGRLLYFWAVWYPDIGLYMRQKVTVRLCVFSSINSRQSNPTTGLVL